MMKSRPSVRRITVLSSICSPRSPLPGMIRSAYTFLTSEETNPKFSGKIGWNFEKFLVSREGKVIARFSPRTKPDSEEVLQALEEALAQPVPDAVKSKREGTNPSKAAE